MSEIPEVIRRLRAAGLSQSEIARRTRIPQPRVSRWAAGEVPVGADDALALVRLADEVAPAEEGGPETPEQEAAA